MKLRTIKKRQGISRQYERKSYVHDRGCVVCYNVRLYDGVSYMTRDEWFEWASNGPVRLKHRPRQPKEFWPDETE